MHQAPVPPGRECSISVASEPGEKHERVRPISFQEQEALEQAPFFDAFCALLYRLTQAALSRHKAHLSEKPLDQVS